MSRGALLLLMLAAAAPAWAAPPALESADGRFTILPKRVAAGGGRAADSRFAAHVTLAQPEASPMLTAGRFMATLGVRQRRSAVAPQVFRDGFE